MMGKIWPMGHSLSNPDLWNYSYFWSVGTFLKQWWSSIVVPKTMCPPKLKIFSICLSNPTVEYKVHENRDLLFLVCKYIPKI